MIKILSLVSIFLFLIFLGCESRHQAANFDTVSKTKIESFGNYLVIDNEILNKDYIVRIGEPINRAIYSGRKLEGYGLDIVLKSSTASGFLGGSPTASRIRIFYGTKEDCLIIQKEILKLLKEHNVQSKAN